MQNEHGQFTCMLYSRKPQRKKLVIEFLTDDLRSFMVMINRTLFKDLPGFTYCLPILVVLCWRFAPKPFQPVHLLAFTPILITLFTVVWGAYWEHKVKGDSWQSFLVGGLFWISISLCVVLAVLFKEHWRFFVPLFFAETYFLWVCAAIAAMALTKQWM